MGSFLEKIKSPVDMQALSLKEMTELAEEVREKIKHTVATTGGHLATNLGIVEITLAVHRVFDFKEDRLIFDVGHQCYTHKIITGRGDRFDTLRSKDGLSGYPNRKESPYDVFNAGHAGTSISAALGLACGDKIIGNDRRVVVIIGDGSIPTGLSFEGLNQLGHIRRNLIIILNDNEMSISKTVGALSRHLTNIRTGHFYNENKKRIKSFLNMLPLGESVRHVSESVKNNLVKGLLPGHFFEELGIRYFGPIDGHSIVELEKVFANCRDLEGPILVHVNTTKGHGYLPAKNDPEYYHGASPFNVDDGSSKKESNGATYSDIFATTLTKLADEDERIVAITAAMPLGTGLTVFEERHPDRFFDVGICEQHAVTFAAGLSEAGLKPVIAIYSTFLQRSYDQIFHDVSMQEDMDVIFAMDRAGLVGSDGFSHHGLVDISMMRVFPHIILMAPKDKAEFELMLAFAVKEKGIFGIRYPREIAPDALNSAGCPEIELGKAEIMSEGADIAVLAYGACVERMLEAGHRLAKDGNPVTCINMRFAKPLDTHMLDTLVQKHSVIITVEDHMIAGGMGSAILEYCHASQLQFKQIIQLGVPDSYVWHATRNQQLAENSLDAEGIINAVNAARRKQ